MSSFARGARDVAEPKSSYRDVRRGYVFALGLLALLTLAGQLLIQATLARQLSDADVINVAGRQRMLSQRLAASLLALPHDEDRARVQIRADVRALEESHQRLRVGDLRAFTDALPAADQARLDDALRTLVEAAKTALDTRQPAPAPRPTPYANTFLQAMDGAVFAYSATAAARVRTTRRLELALALSTLITLALEAWLIFGPLLRRLRRSVETVEDVTGRLAESEARYRRAMAGARDGLWDWDRRTSEVFFSPRFRELAALGEATTWAALTERLAPRDAETLTQALDGEVIDLELRVTTDGEPRWLHLRGVSHGQTHMSGTLSDIDERRRTSDSRDRRLEAQTRDLTATRKELARAEVMTAIGTLASGVAHDFNNYLQIVQLAAESIETDDEEAVQTIVNATTEASSLTHQLLALRKDNAGLVFEQVNVGALVQDTLPLVERSLRANLSLSTEIHSGLPTLWAEPGQIRQILVNLCINARDAIPDEGQIWIRVVAAERSSVDGVTKGVELSVRDEGSGMSPDVQKRLFEPFFSTKRPGRGTGLGLAMVHSIVRRHRGSIDVESELGQGTTVRVWFPRSTQSTPSTRMHWRPPETQLTVLLVDDEGSVRLFARRLLEKAGHRVVEASDAAEALRVAEDHPALDLVVCDIMLPDGYGPEVVEEIRASRTRPTPTVFMSGYTDREVAQDDRTAFLAKPFGSAELLDAVDRVLSGPQDAASPSHDVKA